MNKSRGTLSTVAALAAIGATAAIALAAPSNGNFESGDFDGWETADSGGMMRDATTGEWQVFKGKLKGGPSKPRGGGGASAPKIGKPPQGKYAAGVSTLNAGTHILHRVLEANGKSELSLKLAFHNTSDDFYVQDSLDSQPPFRGMGGDFDNQQLRIDLLEPDAPIDTLEKSDIIETLFRTKPGDKRKRDWKPLSATVKDGEFRLRIAEVDNRAPFGVGVDAVKLKKK